MVPRRLGYEFTILAVLCTLALFLFPAERGPYSAVHGPATVLASFRSRARLWFWIALAALSLSPVLALCVMRVTHRTFNLPEAAPGQPAVLRC